MTEFTKFCSFIEQIDTSKKSTIEPEKRLAHLNSLLNDGLAKALKIAFNAKFISKCAYSCLGYKTSMNEVHSGHYGHLQLDNKFFRLSTCIDFRSFSVKIPASEEKYWNKDTYICWVQSNFFLCIKTLSLGAVRQSQDAFGNYEYSLYDLANGNALSMYGCYSDTELTMPSMKVQLNTATLPKHFNEIAVKGCTVLYKPKYALVRLSRDVYCEYYSTINALKTAKCVKLSEQYLSKMGRTNAKFLEDSFNLDKDKTDNYVKKCKCLKIGNSDFAVVSLNYLTNNLSLLNEIINDCQKRQDFQDKEEHRKMMLPISEDDALSYIELKTGKKVKNISVVKNLFQFYSKLNCDYTLELNQFKYDG